MNKGILKDFTNTDLVELLSHLNVSKEDAKKESI